MFGKHYLYKLLLFIMLTFKKIHEIVMREERKKYIYQNSNYNTISTIKKISYK